MGTRTPVDPTSRRMPPSGAVAAVADEHKAQIRANPGDLPSPDAGDVEEREGLRYSSAARLGLTDRRRPDAAKFEQLEPKRFYLRQDPVHG